MSKMAENGRKRSLLEAKFTKIGRFTYICLFVNIL